jgi:Ca2+-transporting ATPase
LRRLGRAEATVRREGRLLRVPARDLVPGDVVLLEGGDVVTADVRILVGSKLEADESTLTGESVPVAKQVAAVEAALPVSERSNMFFKGTAVTRGSGEGVVVTTGMKTELGRISELVEEAEPESTPLEKRLDTLGQRLVWVTLAVAVGLVVIGIAGGRDLFLVIETTIALAVATVPEGLPIVATVALARGMWRMARRHALVERLSAVETLGSTSVILTDKTGTLTENRMTVTRILYGSGAVDVTGTGLTTVGELIRNTKRIDPTRDPVLTEALEIGALCSNASIGEESDGEATGVGDPTEVALLVLAAKAGFRRERLTAGLPEIREEAFDPRTKMMATFHRTDGELRVAVKGAPEAVLDACATVRTEDGSAPLDEEVRAAWDERNAALAAGGLRVIAVATKRVTDAEESPYARLTLLGFFGLQDPPREGVREALGHCRDAGIRVVMVTGDQAATARSVAEALGLVDAGATPETFVNCRALGSLETATENERERYLGARIFARATPEQKLELIGIHQRTGAIVAMTGDGVNDAPALKRADIGVAMGLRGTQVARETADIVLQDDAFETIVAAVDQGRAIFQNIRNFVFYLISCNVSEVLVVALAWIAGAPLPVLPLQILFLNLVTDVFPALALGVSEGDPTLMERPPRDPAEPVLTRGHWWRIAGYGGLITTAVLGALAFAVIGLGMETRRAVTVSFLTLAFAQLWHVFNMRSPQAGWIRNEITRNPWVWGALAFCVGLLLAAVYLHPLARILHVVDPGASGWTLVLAASLGPLAIGQGASAVVRLWGGPRSAVDREW